MCEFLSQSCRLARRAALLAAVALAAPTAALAQPATSPTLGGAESFAVLAGASVTVSGASTVSGDVGADAGGTVTGFPPGTISPGSSVHEADAVAAQARHDASLAYAALAARPCPAANNLTGQTLGSGVSSLAPGVYCFDGNAPLIGTLTLTGQGPWTLQVGGGLLVAPGASIATPGVADVCKGTDVFWQVGDTDTTTPLVVSTIGTGASFVGNLLALGGISADGNATVDGRLISLGETVGSVVSGGTVSLAANTVNACSYGNPLPTQTPFKVTGGGGIDVPSPNSPDPDATGNGFANYGFNAEPGLNGAPATGRFNYVNHVIAPHIHANGSVTDVDVVGLNGDGTAQTVRFSGTCSQLLPDCTFSVMVQDNGEPGRNDQFGVTIVSNGTVIEARTMRQVRNGNIQFHDASLTTTVNSPTLRPGQTLRLSARLQRRHGTTPADAYVVLRMPDGQMMSWTGSALVPGLVPLVRNFVPVDFVGEILQLRIPGGVPPGYYVWLSALTEPGTLNLLSGVSQQAFTITP